jgi:ADP-ribose pyrophosphatase YjhB (NUDIX family)
MLSQPVVRYSRLKPKLLEANLFMYHLKFLIKEDLVEKVEGGYALTRRGKQFTDRASLESMRIPVQPKVVVTLALQREGDGHWLLLKRKHQPFLDYKGFPSGKVQFGESLADAAARELHEKSGLTGIDLQLQGNMIVHFTDGNEPVNHVIGYVFGGVIPEGILIDFDQEYHHCYIGPESEFYESPGFKGHQQILQWIKRGELFIEEIEFTSDF